MVRRSSECLIHIDINFHNPQHKRGNRDRPSIEVPRAIEFLVAGAGGRKYKTERLQRRTDALANHGMGADDCPFVGVERPASSRIAFGTAILSSRARFRHDAAW